MSLAKANGVQVLGPSLSFHRRFHSWFIRGKGNNILAAELGWGVQGHETKKCPSQQLNTSHWGHVPPSQLHLHTLRGNQELPVYCVSFLLVRYVLDISGFLLSPAPNLHASNFSSIINVIYIYLILPKLWFCRMSNIPESSKQAENHLLHVELS